MDDDQVSEPRQITVVFQDDGTPDVSWYDAASAGDMAVAGRLLLTRTDYALEARAPRCITVDFDVRGTPSFTIDGASPTDLIRAGQWMEAYADMHIRSAIAEQAMAQRSPLHLPNRAARRAHGRGRLS